MKRCEYCHRRIWPWQDEMSNDGSLVHSDCAAIYCLGRHRGQHDQVIEVHEKLRRLVGKATAAIAQEGRTASHSHLGRTLQSIRDTLSDILLHFPYDEERA